MTLAVAEAAIERGLASFVEVGNALREIRERALWREPGYRSFGAYCKERWFLGTSQVGNIIRASLAAQSAIASQQAVPKSIIAGVQLARKLGIRDPRGRQPNPPRQPAPQPVPEDVRREGDIPRKISDIHEEGSSVAPGTPRILARVMVKELGIVTARLVARAVLEITNADPDDARARPIADETGRRGRIPIPSRSTLAF